MKAIVIKAPGGSEVLEYTTSYPTPKIEDGKLLIRVKAIGLNRAELITRAGGSGDAVKFPKIIGIECAGIVEDIGANISHKDDKGWKKGDVVCCHSGGMGRAFDGGYAECALLPPVSVSEPLHPKPGTKWSTLGAIPMTWATAHGSVISSLSLQAGQSLFIRGGSSTAGLVAATIAKRLLGASAVIGTTRNASPERIEKMKAAGMDYILIESDIHKPAAASTKEHGIPEELRADGVYGSGNGVDAVLEFLGTPTLRDSLKVVKQPGGTICILGGLGGGWDIENFTPWEIPSGVKLTTFSSTLHDISFLPIPDILKSIEEGKVSAHIDRIFPISEVQEAHRYMEDSHAVGKVLLAVDGEDSAVIS